MIYTLGRTAAYEQCFCDQERPQKRGRTHDYPGGSVWETPEQAASHAPEGYSVYGVVAEWESDTEPAADGPWHDLLIDADLVRL